MKEEKNRLPPEYKFVELPNDEFQKLWSEWGNKIFQSNDTTMDFQKVLSDDERAQVCNLNKNLSQLFRFNLCLFKGDEFCGWFTGDQYNNETFYMRNSAILPNHRRKGLYTSLMHEVLDRVEKMGFQVVLSRHTTTNNSIIIPKLKAGFIITALEVSDRFGTLVHLSYFLNEKRRRIMQFRAGDLKPDAEIKAALRMNDSSPNSLFFDDRSLLIETDRLILEPITINHVEPMLTVLGEESLYTFVPQNPPSFESLSKTYGFWQKRKSPDGQEVWLNWAAKSKATKEYIGHFQSGWDQKNGFSVAYTVGVKFQRQGFAKEAIGTIIDFLKSKFEAKSLRAWIDTRNKPSVALIKSLGFVQNGYIENADEFKGSKSNEFIFEKVLL